MCNRTFVAAAVLGAALLGAQSQALAIEATQDDWAFMTSARGMDANRDDVVSRQEFLDTMGKAYDRKAREMNADHRGLDAAQMDAFLRSLYVGG